MMSGKSKFLYPCLLLLSISVLGNPGKFDHSFGTAGVVSNTIAPGGAEGRSIAVQPDGKIVVAGLTASPPMTWPQTFTMLQRFNPDGSLDAGFQASLMRDIPLDPPSSAFYGVKLQPDGKMVVVGAEWVFSAWRYEYRLFILERRNSDGSLDTTFGANGRVRTWIGNGPNPDANPIDFDLQADGKVLVSGLVTTTTGQTPVLVRYNANGSLDTSFGVNGILTISVIGQVVRVQEDQKILVAGWSSIYRYNANGTLDRSFGSGGAVGLPVAAQGLAVRQDGKLVVGGYTFGGADRFSLLQLLQNGQIDTSFGVNGQSLVNNLQNAYGMVLQLDGKIVAVGYGPTYSMHNIVRWKANGVLDTTFGQGGSVPAFRGIGRTAAVGIQPDGKIVTTGVARGTTGINDLLVARNLAYDTGFDYDVDGRADVSVFRPSEATWYLQRFSAGQSATLFGTGSDTIAPADFDSDGKADIAVFRQSEGTWYVLNSSSGTVSNVVFGSSEDLPTPADYDGDGRSDVSVFRPSTGTWYRINSSNGSFYGVQFGLSEDKPTVGDFDGDGKSDIAVFRPSTGAWYRINSSNGSFYGVQFGISTDLIAPADYDGDGKTDIAVFRPSNNYWYIFNSLDSSVSYAPWGTTGDIPAPADFDRDGRADINVFRPSDGNWYRLNSSNGQFVATNFGQNGDRPTQAAFRY